MTVNNASSKSSLYVGDNVTAAFPFTFRVLSASGFQVVVYDTTTGTLTTLVLNVDYTVVLASGGLAGGTITLTAGALASTKKLQIFRVTPPEQDVDIPTQGNFNASIAETAWDKAMLLIQELQEVVSRAIVMPKISEETPDDLVADIALAMTTAQNAVTIANSAVVTANNAYPATVAYVNAALASVLPVTGQLGIIWETTVAAGSTEIVTPYKFAAGLLSLGGALYKLAGSDYVTLDNTGANTVIKLIDPDTTLPKPTIAEFGAILVVFS